MSVEVRLNVEVRVPLTEGPGFIAGTFYERETNGDVTIGLVKKSGYSYGSSRLTAAQFWQIADALFPEGRPADADASLRRGSD